MNLEKPSIYQYSNYRDYLRDFYQWNKCQDPAFSLRYFGARAGIKSYNYLKLIIDGERRLTSKFLSPFSKALKLTAHEHRYFETLVNFSEAQDAVVKMSFFEKLNELKKPLSPYFFDSEKTSLCDFWYYIPLMELTEVRDFRYDLSWMARKLGIKTSQVRVAIKKLIKTGLLKELGGSLVKTNSIVDSTDDIEDFRIQKFHRDTISKSLDRIFEQSIHERELGSLTFSVSDEKIKKIKAKIKALMDDVFKILDEPGEKGTEVQQLNLQLFRLSNKPKSRQGAVCTL